MLAINNHQTQTLNDVTSALSPDTFIMYNDGGWLTNKTPPLEGLFSPFSANPMSAPAQVN